MQHQQRPAGESLGFTSANELSSVEQGMGFLPAWWSHPSQQVQSQLIEGFMLHWGQGKLFIGQKELIKNKKPGYKVAKTDGLNQRLFLEPQSIGFGDIPELGS